MYPLSVVVVGCSPNIQPQVRGELATLHAHVEAEFPDIATAVERGRSAGEWLGTDQRAAGRGGQDRPRLFVVHLKSPRELPELKWLTGTYVGQPVLALLRADEDQSFLIQAMREGAFQVVLLPLQSGDFKAALDCIALQFGRSAASTARVIAVGGVTGGCGATTLALNLAWEFAEGHKTRCALVELSHQMGKLANYLSLDPAVTLHNLLEDIGRVDAYRVQRALVPVSERLGVLTGPHQAICHHAVSARDLLQIIGLTRLLAEVVILDVPCTYDDLYFQALAAADQTVLVGEQKVPSIRALVLVADTLESRAPGRTPFMVINRHDPRLKGFSVADLAQVLRVPHVHAIANDPRGVDEAINNGRPLRLQAPSSRVLTDVAALARTLLTAGQNPAGRPTSPSGVSRLFRALGLS